MSDREEQDTPKVAIHPSRIAPMLHIFLPLVECLSNSKLTDGYP